MGYHHPPRGPRVRASQAQLITEFILTAMLGLLIVAALILAGPALS